MSSLSLKVGQKIELSDGRVATVRFVGSTAFQTGEWVGVELEEATGKNDGSVKGQRYFQCEQGYGMFLRPAGVRQVLQDVKPRSARPQAGTGKGRPSSVQSGINGLKRQSLAAGSGSPTPGARAGLSGLRSPTKSPTKQLGSNGASSTSTSRTSTPPVGKKPATTAAAAPTRSRQSILPASAAAGRRTSTLPSAPAVAAQRGTRPSLAAAGSGGSSSSSRPATGRAASSRALDDTSQGRLSSTTEEDANDDDSEQPDTLSPRESEASQSIANSIHADEEDKDDTIRPSFAPPPVPPDPPESPPFSRSRRPSSPAAASIHSQKTIRSTAASARQIEELETKVRLLERKRLEDRDVKKSLEKALQEREQYKGIIEKLQTKYKPQQQEIADLKQALAKSEERIAEIENNNSSHDTMVEMAMVDREMAEETAENLRLELEALRAQNEEVRLELEILREENQELGKEMSPEERESAGFVQLQHSNDRLRNALLALRDRSMDERAELEQQIKSLEEELQSHHTLRTEHDDTREKLLRSEANIEDLRQQLEAALEAEELIEQLTERNNRLENANTDLRDAIEDLENLKELNDELEINHVEAEKQMQDEIEFKDSLLQDRERMAQTLQDALDDRNQIINQFRAFVSSLQTEMADMKASKEISESEAKQLEGKSRAMLDLNLKLQNSAAKTQVKTIDLELRRLDAQEASEHLAIVQLFLPEAFHTERDSVFALLRFKRIGFKAGLVLGFVKERIASFGSRGTEEDVFAACDVLDKLTWVSAMAERFVNSICACSVEAFAAYESALYELEPVERALNSYIDGLRREDLNEKQMAQELQRSIAVMDHLASIHIKNDLASHADGLLMRTKCLQSQLESTATALQLTKGMVERYVSKADSGDDESEDDEGSASDLAILLTRADSLVNHVRSAKVMAGKTHRSLEDLQQRALTLDTTHSDSFDSTEHMSQEIAKYARQAGDALQVLFAEEGRGEAFTSAEVASVLSRTAMSTFDLQAPEAGPFTSLASRLREMTNMVADLASLPADLDNTVEFERSPAPWVARANQLNQTKLTSTNTEAELARTLETLHGKESELRAKETELEEQSVRIEMLEARMKDASKRSARIGELEGLLREAKESEMTARKEVDRVKEEMGKELERARHEVSKAGDTKASNGVLVDGDAMGTNTRLAISRLEAKISSLEGAIRLLKRENMELKLPPDDSPLSTRNSQAWLHRPLTSGKSKSSDQKASLQREGKEVLERMLEKVAKPLSVDLTTMPENKLAWRPAKQSSRWLVEKGKEDWEQLKGWRRRVAREVVRASKVC